jgi:hypothetical protein
MKRSILLVLFTVFFSVISFGQDDIRATAAWQVKNYDITATAPQNPADRNLGVKALLNLQNVGTAAGSRLTLRIASTAQVSAVTVNGNPAAVTKGEEKLGQKTLQRIIVSVPNVQPNSAVAVSVDYALKVEENSGLNSLSSLGTQFLPLSFWYPTPNSQFAPKGPDYAPFRLTINAANGDTAVSSGTQTGSAFDQKLNGQPFFATGNWDTIESKGVTVLLPKGASDSEKQRAAELANLVVEAKTYTASLLGTASDMPMRIVAVRQGAGFADGGTIFLDYAAFRRSKIDSATAMTIGESVAKIWLGNIKLVRGEGYGAIREGLSLFVATQFLEKQYGRDAADNERLRQRTAYTTIANVDAPLNLASPLDNAYFSSVANKGAMVWRVIADQMGAAQFFGYIRSQDPLTILNLRASFSNKYPVIDYWLQNPTDTNLLVGLPQAPVNGEIKVALRNAGGFPAFVTVTATTDKGEKLNTTVSIPEKGFAEASFKTASKIIRTEVDGEKLYPQLDYSDDVAPREFDESDLILVIKRAFDKQDFAGAEKKARLGLQSYPHFDEARTWLGRALLAQNNTAEADREFKAALDEKLPTAFTQGWANIGLGEISLRAGQNSQAAMYFNQAIKADAEYGSNLAARRGRAKVEATGTIDDAAKTFFNQFDKAVLSGRKADVDALIAPGELTKFSGGAVGGQPSQWQTKVLRTEKIDTNRMTVETEIAVKRIGSEVTENGTAIFVLAKAGTGWKLAGIEVFEVR